MRASMLLVTVLLVCCRATSDGVCTEPTNSLVFTALGDRDGDTLDDGFETAAAHAYLPFLASHPEDACARSGIVFRVRPHPDDGALLHIVYSWVYELDCGLNGHVGDNEAFGATVDPGVPPPGGLVALVAVSHQSTLCERATSCGMCAGMPRCDLVEGRPVLYASKDKHAGAVDIGGGCSIGSCFDSCAPSAKPAVVPMVNAGEPEAPLVENLTTQGFITADNGWTEPSLFDVDPWAAADFGSAGNIAGDLIDEVFVPPACSCRQAD